MPLHSQPVTNITQDAQEVGTLQSRLHTKCRILPDRPVLAHPSCPSSRQIPGREYERTAPSISSIAPNRHRVHKVTPPYPATLLCPIH